jgi:hypothetical protein
MFSPTGLYACGAIFVTFLVVARVISSRRKAGLIPAAAAVTAIESGLLTEFGLPLPAGLLLVLAGATNQLVVSGGILVVNLLLAWALFRLLTGREARIYGI